MIEEEGQEGEGQKQGQLHDENAKEEENGERVDLYDIRQDDRPRCQSWHPRFGNDMYN